MGLKALNFGGFKNKQTGWYIEPSYRVNGHVGFYTRYEDVEAARDRDRGYEALKPLLEFTWRTRERGMVHAYALQRRLVNARRITAYRIIELARRCRRSRIDARGQPNTT